MEKKTTRRTGRDRHATAEAPAKQYNGRPYLDRRRKKDDDAAPKGRSYRAKSDDSAPKGRTYRGKSDDSAPKGRTYRGKSDDSAPKGRTYRGSSDSAPKGRTYRGKSGDSAPKAKGFRYSESDAPKGRDYRKREYGGRPARNTRPVKTVKPETQADLEPVEGEEWVRLNRFIANSGICSRREADEYIQTGLITVNGEHVTTLGAKVRTTDDIRFNGQRLKGEKKVYLIMNKPKGYVTTMSDPHADKTVMQLISVKECPQRVYPVGRLDKNTTGLLMFTNDGEMTERLTHPSNGARKIYHVTLDKKVTKAHFDAILRGIELEDGEIHADTLSYVDGDKQQIGIEIHSGRNRIVRRIFEHFGYEVTRLDRVYFAGLTKKALTRGTWRFLTETEVAKLKMGAFE